MYHPSIAHRFLQHVDAKAHTQAGDRSLVTIHGTSRRDSESGHTATPTRPAPQDGLLLEPRIRGDRCRRRIHSPERSATVEAEAEETEGRLPDRLCSKGLRALTTMLMLGRKSPSYCTHRAATAAILATAFGGYSPSSLGSTHCLTLSSLSLGVAHVTRLCWPRGSV